MFPDPLPAATATSNSRRRSSRVVIAAAIIVIVIVSYSAAYRLTRYYARSYCGSGYLLLAEIATNGMAVAHLHVCGTVY